MVLSKLLRAFGLFVLVVLAILGVVGYKLYSAFAEHGEFEFGWAVSDPEPEA
ncbi:hypothetical protein [Halalkalicoccus subterraneus]|uniref:hypothetical protein n=1 Tax=Halalkalicoccus subterraneus TaxID=2675002 RepID=UPI0013CEA788|nr:hypothetical protein [Halalkalicoccus subterraneus]